MTFMPKNYELPHLTSAIRQFGGITQPYEVTSSAQVSLLPYLLFMYQYVNKLNKAYVGKLMQNVGFVNH